MMCTKPNHKNTTPAPPRHPKNPRTRHKTQTTPARKKTRPQKPGHNQGKLHKTLAAATLLAITLTLTNPQPPATSTAHATGTTTSTNTTDTTTTKTQQTQQDRQDRQSQLFVAPSKTPFTATDENYEFQISLPKTADGKTQTGTLNLYLQQNTNETNTQTTPFLNEKTSREKQDHQITVNTENLGLTPQSTPGPYTIHAYFTPTGHPKPHETNTDTNPQNPDTTGNTPDPNPTQNSAASTKNEEQTLTATSHIVWEGSPGPHTPLTAIIPLTLEDTPTHAPRLKDIENQANRLENLVQTAIKNHATLAIDPRIPIAIRAGKTTANQATQKLLETLEDDTLDSKFLLQYADADPQNWQQLTGEKTIKLDNLTFFARLAGGGETPIAPDPETFNTNASAVAWLPPAKLAREAQTASREIGLGPEAVPAWMTNDSPYGTLIIDSARTANHTSPKTVIDETTLLIADSALGAAFTKFTTATNPVEREAAFAHTAALLAHGWTQEENQQPGTGKAMLLAPDHDAPAGFAHANLAADYTRIFNLPWVQAAAENTLPTGAATLLPKKIAADATSVTPPKVNETVKDSTVIEPAVTAVQLREQQQAMIDRQDAARADQLAALERGEKIVPAGSLLQNPADLAGYQRYRLFELFQARFDGRSPDNTIRDEVYRVFAEADELLLDGVTVVSSKSVQLVSERVKVPVQLRNYLPFKARVDLLLGSANAAIDLESSKVVAADVPAGGGKTVLVSVRSRVTSGQSAIVVSVRARQGEYVTYEGVLPLNINSRLEVAAVSALAIVAIALLSFGIVRSVRRKKVLAAARKVAEKRFSARSVETDF